MIVILKNSFHNRECRVRVPELPYTLTQSQAARVRSELCGHTDCTCGAVRGPQEVGCYVDGTREGKATWTLEEAT